MSFTGKMEDGTELEVKTPAPSTCRVEIVETHELVPAYMETRKRYKLVGDCLPITRPIDFE